MINLLLGHTTHFANTKVCMFPPVVFLSEYLFSTPVRWAAGVGRSGGSTSAPTAAVTRSGGCDIVLVFEKRLAMPGPPHVELREEYLVF